jgi:mercuric ion transport protein
MTPNQLPDSAKDGALAAGSIFAAAGASACCIVPLALALAGISGAWIGRLTALAPYQPVFLGLGVISVGSGLWRVYGRNRSACGGAHCGTVTSRRWTKAGLWLAAVLLIIAATTTWWAPLIT